MNTAELNLVTSTAFGVMGGLWSIRAASATGMGAFGMAGLSVLTGVALGVAVMDRSSKHASTLRDPGFVSQLAEQVGLVVVPLSSFYVAVIASHLWFGLFRNLHLVHFRSVW